MKQVVSEETKTLIEELIEHVEYLPYEEVRPVMRVLGDISVQLGDWLYEYEMQSFWEEQFKLEQTKRSR